MALQRKAPRWRRSEKALRWLTTLAAISLGAAGCDDCGRPPPPPTGGETLPLPADKLAAPSNEALFALWQGASGGVRSEDAAPAKAALRYQIQPGCALQYAMRYRQLADLAPGRPRAGSEYIVDFEVEQPAADAGRNEWTLQRVLETRLRDGERHAQPSAKPSSRAVVTTHGRQWQEIDGPHMLWRVFTSYPHMATLFPTLPSVARPPAHVVWQLGHYKARTVRALAARRKAGAGSRPRVRPTITEIPVELVKWVTLRATKPAASDEATATDDAATGDATTTMRAAVLVAEWTEEEIEDAPIGREEVAHWKARFVVSENGRLLHAARVANTRLWWAPLPGESNEKLGNIEHELRLVKACDGIQLPAFTEPIAAKPEATGSARTKP